jgi:hypothetical protein
MGNLQGRDFEHCMKECLMSGQVPMTCVNKAQWRLAIKVIDRIKQPAASVPSNMSHRRSSGLISQT